MNENERPDNPTPYLKASRWSKRTYSWIGGLLSIGRKKQLNLDDLYSPYSSIECKNLTDELELEWQSELDTHPDDPQISRPLKKLYLTKLMLNFLYIAIQELMKIFQPLFIALILQYFNGKIDLDTTLIYAGVVSVLAAFGGILHHPYYSNAYKFGMKARVALTGLIYRKIIKVGTTRFDSKTGGDVVNLLANDTDRVEKAFLFVAYLFVGPPQIIVVIVVILNQIGFSFLTGLVLVFGILPIKAILALIFNKFRSKNCQVTDNRISVLTEILGAIKIIKMYCWEKPFADKATELRNKELKFQLFLNTLQAISYSMDNTMALLMTLLNISTFIASTSLPLFPSFLVFSLGFYTRLCYSVGFNVSRSASALITGIVSLKRINKFLLVDELPPANDKCYFGDDVSIKVENLSFGWDKKETETKARSGEKKSPTVLNLNNISFDLENGELLVVIGPVGCGKSTLLLGLIGELENYTGQIDVKGRVAYISQQPWIFSASIKQNILFGNDFDQEKFDKIVEVCSLKKDLELLPFAENTIASEKGVNLSGGQRARISMARALYSDADIFLFDDSLSAVDAPVAKFLLSNCINGYLKSKIRILITHQAQHLRYADKIIIMKEGKIESSGTYNEAVNFNLDNLNLMSHLDPNHKDELDDEEEQVKSVFDHPVRKVLSDEMKQKQQGIKNDRLEAQQAGSVSWKTYFQYFTAGGSFFGIFLFVSIIILFLAAQTALVMTDFWLSRWSTNEEKYFLENQIMQSHILNKTDHNNVYPDRAYHYYGYLILTAASLILILIRSLVYFYMCVRVSKRVYEKLYMSVTGTSIKFFELNPLGRILNRFTKDTNNMDDMIPAFIFEFLHLVMIVGGALIVPIIINYYILIPLVPIVGLFMYIRSYFIVSGRELKRLENIARSPILVHANSTVEGIATIRCSSKEEILCREFEKHNDDHTRAYHAFYISQRWFGLRLDFLCSLFTIFVLFYCIYMKDYLNLSTGQMGILMCYLFQLFDLFQWCVIMTTIIENLMTSVERIIEYTQLETEHINSVTKKPHMDWPSKGHIVFDDVSLKYDRNLPSVLKGISVAFSPSEKVGIVGRTGAGKSSFFQAIFRMYNPEGNVRIDGIDIKSLCLADLRSKLTIIPQEPLLFSGTIRFNLDPFGKHDDLDLWNALESVNLKDSIQEIKGRLDSMITQGGSNMSVGQKQLFCLARAILKKTKILIIDEATANVDYKTDVIIQKAIREQFKDCTVLTIAHRLSTVVDNDRILCLSEGEIKNFGRPIDLLLDETSVLYELTKKLSKQEKRILFEIINQNRLNSLKDLEANHVSKIQTENIIVKNDSIEENDSTNSFVNHGQTIIEDE